MKCNVVINPFSGKGKAVRVWEKVASIFHDSGWVTTVHITPSREIIQYFCDCDAVITVGGDGTFHNLVNQFMHSPYKLPLGVIPAGTGNDVMRDLDCFSPWDTARRIVEGKRRFVDVLEISTNEEIIYSICVAGWGMFSAANQTAEKLRWLKGKRYTIAALWHLLFKKTYPARVTYGDEVEEGEFITVFASNTIHTGKGMKMASKAKVDDGLIDLIILKNVSRLTLLKLFRKFSAGRYLDHKQVIYKQISSFELKTNVHQFLNIDGEIKGSSPFSVRILPQAVELLL